MNLIDKYELPSSLIDQSSEPDWWTDPRIILLLLRRRWKIIAGTTGLGAGLVILNLFLTTPLYTAKTEILLDPGKKNVVDSNPVYTELGSNRAEIASQIHLIKSTAIARRVTEKLDLMNDPVFVGRPSAIATLITGLKEWLGLSGSEAAAKNDGSVSEKLEEEEPLESEEERLDRFVQGFSRMLKTRRLGSTYVIELSIVSNNPQKAAEIVNEFAAAYLVDQLEARYEATKRASNWLRERLGILQKRLLESERVVELYRAKHNLIGVSGQTLSESQLEKLNSELILARVQMNERLAQYQQVAELVKSKGKLTSIDAVAESDIIGKLRGQILETAQAESELSTRYTPNHPKVQNKQTERRNLERRVRLEAQRIVKNIENAYDVSRRRVAVIEEGLAVLKNITKDVRQASIRLRQLERIAVSNRTVYEAFLSRFKQTSEQDTLAVAHSRIIARAIPPSTPTYPNKRRTTFLAFIGFFAIGTGLAFLVEHFDDTFKTPEQIEEALGIGHLASVPKLSAADLTVNGKTIPIEGYTLANPLSAYAEVMSKLKVNINHSNIDRPPQIVMITSPVPSEGKTILAANFARHAAHAGTKTLLIDADLRNPSLTKSFGGATNGTLIDLLANQGRQDRPIVEDPSGLDFIPAEHIRQNSAEILGSEKMAKLLNEFRNFYSLIILDTSPILPVIDAKVVVKCADCVVLVVEWDKTKRQIAKNAIKTLNLPVDKIAGAVLSKMDMKRMALYQHYDTDYYYQKYPYYHGSRE